MHAAPMSSQHRPQRRQRPRSAPPPSLGGLDLSSSNRANNSTRGGPRAAHSSTGKGSAWADAPQSQAGYRGSVYTRRAPPLVLALRSVVLEPDRGRNIASHVAPLVATLSWPSLDLVSSAGRCAHVAPRPRCSRFSPSSRCLCSSDLRLRVETGEGAALGVFLSTACKTKPSRGVGLTILSSRCLCSSGLRLRVDTGEGAAPGVFLSTARPAAAISRR